LLAVYFHAQTDADEAVFKSQTPTIVALTKGCKNAKVVRRVDDVPAGCGSAVLSDTLTVYILVRVRRHLLIIQALANMLTPWACGFFIFIFCCTQGLVDLDSEIAKCDKKLGLAMLNTDKLRKIEAQPDYETMIPEAVRASNSDKVSATMSMRW
jgi:valyl-tRNA synthetase